MAAVRRTLDNWRNIAISLIDLVLRRTRGPLLLLSLLTVSDTPNTF